MAKKTEELRDLPKVDLECIDKENDIWIAKDLMPEDSILCTIEKQDLAYSATKKKFEVSPLIQDAIYTGGMISILEFNSEGYNDSNKITLVGKLN